MAVTVITRRDNHGQAYLTETFADADGVSVDEGNLRVFKSDEYGNMTTFGVYAPDKWISTYTDDSRAQTIA